MKSSSEKIVIVGAFGRLGTELSLHYGSRIPVVRLGRKQLDLADESSIRKALEPLDFTLLFLPAAQTLVDRCEDEKEEAYQLNAHAPGIIAKICAEKGARMVHFSTDFVFDGEKDSPYHEEDATGPISVYGASKLAGEEFVLAASSDHLVIRLSWLFGPAKPGFPEWIVEQACSEYALALPAEKRACPSYSSDIVSLLDPLLFRPQESVASGVFHLSNNDDCSWQEWGQECLDLAHEMGHALKTHQISATSLDTIQAFKALRPVNSAMSSTKYTRVTGVTPRGWREALRDHFFVSAKAPQACL